MNNDLTKIYKEYKGLWVALDSNWEIVISADENAQIAHKKAIEKGYKLPIMFKVPAEDVPYVGTL